MMLRAGDGFMASVESFGGSGVRVGRSKAAPDQTCFVVVISELQDLTGTSLVALQ